MPDPARPPGNREHVLRSPSFGAFTPRERSGISRHPTFRRERDVGLQLVGLPILATFGSDPAPRRRLHRIDESYDDRHDHDEREPHRDDSDHGDHPLRWTAVVGPRAFFQLKACGRRTGPDLIDELGRLPGVGPKSAQRIAFHLLAADLSRRAAERERPRWKHISTWSDPCLLVPSVPC